MIRTLFEKDKPGYCVEKKLQGEEIEDHIPIKELVSQFI